jgi:hypothetical protein
MYFVSRTGKATRLVARTTRPGVADLDEATEKPGNEAPASSLSLESMHHVTMRTANSWYAIGDNMVA